MVSPESSPEPDPDAGSEQVRDTEPIPEVIKIQGPPGPSKRKRRIERGEPTGTQRRRRRADRRKELPGDMASGEQQPSKVVENYLFGSERFRGEWRKHPLSLWKQILAAALSPFVVGYAGGLLANSSPVGLQVLLLLWALLLVWVMWGVADWYYDRFVLTNRRIMEVSGIVTRRVAMMPLGRVTDMAYVQGVVGRMLNFGTFIIESAGQDQALREIKTLPRPNALYLLLCDEMYGGGEAPPPKRTRTKTKASSS